MEFYLTIFGILMITVILEYFGLRKQDTIKIYSVYCLIFFVLSFIRWDFSGVGDWTNYINYFTIYQWGDDSITNTYEWGYTLANWIVGLLTDDYTILLLFLSVIIFLFQYIGVVKLSPLPIMSLWVLWTIQFCHIHYVRQWIAVAILFYGLISLQKREFWKFFLLVFLAAGFHRTSWIFLLAWFIWKIEWKYCTMLIILAGVMLLSSFFMTIMESLGPLMGEVIERKIAMYTNDTYNENEAEALNLVAIMLKGIPNKLLVLFCAIWAYGKLKDTAPQLRGYINIYWFGSIMYFLFIPVSIVLVRFSYPFDIVQILLIPYVFSAIKRNDYKLMALFILTLYLGMRFWQVLNGVNSEYYIPFTTIFDL